MQPRADRNEIVGMREGVLLVRVTAPPVEGEANRACRDFLAARLGLRRADLELVAGSRSREKRFRVARIAGEELRARVEAALRESGG